MGSPERPKKRMRKRQGQYKKHRPMVDEERSRDEGDETAYKHTPRTTRWPKRRQPEARNDQNDKNDKNDQNDQNDQNKKAHLKRSRKHERN